MPTRVPDVAVLPDRVGLWPGPWAPTRCPGAGRGDLLFTPLFASSERRQSTTSLEPTRSSSSLSLPCSCVPSHIGTFGFPALSSYAHASSASVCLSLPPVPPPSHTHFLAQVTPPPAGFLLGPSTWPHARDRLLLALPLRTSPPPGILADLSRQKRTPCPRGRGALGCLSPAPGLGTPQNRGALPCLWAQPRVHCNTGVECRPRRRRPGRETGFSRLSQEQPHKRLRPRPSTRCHLRVPPAALAGVLGGPRAPGPSAGP